MIDKRILTTVNEAHDYLFSQSGGTKDNPVSLFMKMNIGDMYESDSGWWHILKVISDSKKYVNLDLSACSMCGTTFDPRYPFSIGKKRIISLALPDTATDILEKEVNKSFEEIIEIK